MKILVTGGAGYIGGTVARILLAGGHAVTIYDNLCHSKAIGAGLRARSLSRATWPTGRCWRRR